MRTWTKDDVKRLIPEARNVEVFNTNRISFRINGEPFWVHKPIVEMLLEARESLLGFKRCADESMDEIEYLRDQVYSLMLENTAIKTAGGYLVPYPSDLDLGQGVAVLLPEHGDAKP